GGLVLGRHIDRGHGGKAVWLALGVVATIIVLRALAAGSGVAVVTANALGALGACLYTPTLITAVDTQAKRSPFKPRFRVVAEGGWDVGGASAMLVAALLSALGVPLWVGILMSLAGVLAMAVMLRRYYSGVAAWAGRGNA